MSELCVVTGAASGIGAATVERLRAGGRAVVGWDLQEPAEAGWLQVDVTDADSVDRAWARTVEQGQVTGLVNAAGIWRLQGFAETSLADWTRMLAVNLTGVYLTCAKAVPAMTAARRGAIVNLASLAALRPPKAPCAAYAASKGAVLAFSRALAAELGPFGVRVNCISPGAIATPMLTTGATPAQLAAYAGQSSLGRLGRPAEVAALICYLLSEEASFVHGANVEVAGA